MPDYHLNVHDQPGVCKARPGHCPLSRAGTSKHYTSLEAAQQDADRKAEAKANWRPLSKEAHTSEQIRVWADNDLRTYRGEPSSEEREEYIRGFNKGLEHSIVQEKELSREIPEWLKGASSAFYRGARRGQVAELDPQEKEFITKGVRISFSGNMSEATATKIRRLRIIDNPFKTGDEVFIPAGTPYYDGYEKQVTKRATKIRVHSTSPGYSDAGVGHLTMTPSAIFADPWRNYTLTPELLAANQKELFQHPHAHENKQHDTRPGSNDSL